MHWFTVSKMVTLGVKLHLTLSSAILIVSYVICLIQVIADQTRIQILNKILLIIHQIKLFLLSRPFITDDFMTGEFAMPGRDIPLETVQKMVSGGFGIFNKNSSLSP